MNPYLRSKGANKHEFFKRLKDKLMGNPAEEEKLEAADKEQDSRSNRARGIKRTCCY